MRNYKIYLIKKLKLYSVRDIKITSHAEIRMIQRQINKEEVLNNIINPKRLEYAIKEDSQKLNEEKFDCYFGYSKTQCHRYVLVIKCNVIVVTIIKINRRWQRIVEKKLKGVIKNDSKI
jgi:hypothetical protein